MVRMTCKVSIIVSLILMVTGTLFAQKMGTFKDVRDGRTYLSVTLHDQVWMAENLSFRSGTNSEGCWVYLSNQQNAEVYGYLYTYETAQKVCPQGWHLPAKSEWDTLFGHYGGILSAGGSLKERGFLHWNSPNIEANNESEFNALPGGRYELNNNIYSFLGSTGFWWSYKENDSSTVSYGIQIYADRGSIESWDCDAIENCGNSFGFSVRCVKDSYLKTRGHDYNTIGDYKDYKLFKNSKETIKPKIGDWVSLNMRYKYKDSTLFNSKTAMNTPVRFQLPVSDFYGDIYQGIKLLSPGDSAEFIVSADSVFIKTFKQSQRPAFIDDNSSIHFYISLLSIDSEGSLIKKEEEALKQYLEEKTVTVTPTASGLFYIETVAGKGTKINIGNRVKVHFKVYLIDGKQIFSTYDRGESMEFEFGKRFDTPGFEEGVSKMHKGGKATLIVPSAIAFGEKGRGSMVPPYSTLVYKVEIVDVIP